MPTVFVFQNHVSWQEIFQRLPRPVQRLCAMLETPRNICGPSDVKFFTWWTTLCKGIPRRSAANFQARFPSGQMMLEPVILSRQPQTSVSFLRKFTWTLLHAPPHPCIHAPTGSHGQLRKFTWTLYYMPHPTPPHPTRAYMHLPAATDKHVLPPQVHMNVILHAPPHPTPPVHTCTYRQPRTSMSFLRKFTWTLYYMPHPTPPHPPMCTKHHGLLKAVVQLYIYIYVYTHLLNKSLIGKWPTFSFTDTPSTWICLQGANYG